MPDSLQRILGEIVAYVAGLNAREKALVGLLLSLSLLYGAVWAFDLSEAARTKLEDAREELQAARAAENDTEGEVERVVAARVAEVTPNAFQAATHLIARARFQSSLERAGREAGVAQLKISMVEELTGQGDIRLARATLEGQYDELAFVKLLEQLSTLDKLTFVTAAGADIDAAQWFRLVVEAPVMQASGTAP
jgi:hypothetical protein